MNNKIIYWAGTILLFLGLLWMFLPHTTHIFITNENETRHYLHLIQGAILTLIGLSLLFWLEKH